MNTLTKIANVIDQTNLYVGRKVAWLTLFMVGVTCITVIQRYLFASNHIWENEIILYAHSLVFLASSGYVLQTNAHIRVDILYERFNAHARAWCNLLGTLFFLLPFCIVTSYYAYDFIISSWKILEKSREYDGLPTVYILKTFIWFFTLSLFLQAISSIIRNYYILTSPKRDFSIK